MVASVALVAGIAWSPLLDVDRIVVVGAEHVDIDLVVEASGVTRSTPLVTVDREATARHVEELAWVREATVTRTWPGTLTIAVVERTPVARVEGTEGQRFLVDRRGRVLGPEGPLVASSLPTLSGVGTPAEAGSILSSSAAGALELAVLLPSATPPDMGVFAVERQASGRLVATMTLPDGSWATVLFGNADQLPDKVLSWAAVLTGVDVAGITAIDVSVPSAPSLTRG